MKAIILAAGYATRLYPLTENMPKALLPIGGRPMIDYIVDQLQTIEAVDDIFVVSNHKFIAYFEQWAAGCVTDKPLHVLDDGTTSEQDRKGAIGDIDFTVALCGIDDDVIIIAGDNLFTFRLKDCYDYYISTGKDCVAAKEIGDRALLRQFAVAKLDENGKIIELVEKPEHPASNIAVFATYLYKKETVPLFRVYLEQGNKPDAPGYFVQWLYTRKDVYAYIMDGECYDIGTVESYAKAQTLFQ